MTKWEWCKINLFLDNFFPLFGWDRNRLTFSWNSGMMAVLNVCRDIHTAISRTANDVCCITSLPLMRWTVDCSVQWSLTVVRYCWWMASPDVEDRFMVPNILLVQPFNSLFFPFIVHVILQTIQKHEPAISLPLCNLVISWCMFACMPQVWKVEVPNLSWSKISFYNEGLDGVKRKILSQK